MSVVKNNSSLKVIAKFQLSYVFPTLQQYNRNHTAAVVTPAEGINHRGLLFIVVDANTLWIYLMNANIDEVQPKDIVKSSIWWWIHISISHRYTVPEWC